MTSPFMQEDFLPVRDIQILAQARTFVIELAQGILANRGYLSFFDNWFISVMLLVHLHSLEISAIGTIGANRITGCSLPTDSELKKKGRGSHVEKEAHIDGARRVPVVKWCDNRVVTEASTFSNA